MRHFRGLHRPLIAFCPRHSWLDYLNNMSDFNSNQDSYNWVLTDLTAFLYQRMRDYCIGMISSRWAANGANVCGAGGL